MLKVIAGIDNDREVFRREDLGEPVGEFRAADTASKSNDFQFNGSSRRPRRQFS